MNLYIKVGSITNAQRGERILRSKGFKSQIRRIEQPSKTDGCGYALEVSTSSKEPIQILVNNSIRVIEADWI